MLLGPRPAYQLRSYLPYPAGPPLTVDWVSRRVRSTRVPTFLGAPSFSCTAAVCIQQSLFVLVPGFLKFTSNQQQQRRCLINHGIPRTSRAHPGSTERGERERKSGRKATKPAPPAITPKIRRPGDPWIYWQPCNEKGMCESHVGSLRHLPLHNTSGTLQQHLCHTLTRSATVRTP